MQKNGLSIILKVLAWQVRQDPPNFGMEFRETLGGIGSRGDIWN
jgi:hypothetical protein